jgi:AraC family transcriptional regulator
VEVSDFSDIPQELTRNRLPAQRYASFTRHRYISTIRSTVYTIWNKYLSELGLEVADAPDFECYDKRFDP